MVLPPNGVRLHSDADEIVGGKEIEDFLSFHDGVRLHIYYASSEWHCAHSFRPIRSSRAFASSAKRSTAITPTEPSTSSAYSKERHFSSPISPGRSSETRSSISWALPVTAKAKPPRAK